MPPQNEKVSNRSCLVLSLLVFVVIPFSIIALGLLLWFGRESSGRSQLKARLSSLTKQGYPVDEDTLETFQKDRTDPTNTAAWLAVLSTIDSDAYKESTKGIAYLDIEMSNVPPLQLSAEWKEEAATMAFLEKWRSVYSEAIRLSIDAKSVRFPIVYNSLATDMSRIQTTRELARLFQLYSRIAIRKRDSKGVREVIEGHLGLSQVIAGEPVLISHLVAMAVDGMALGVLKDAIKYDVLNESDLQALLPRVLAATKIGKEWETAIAGERALTLPIFTDSKKARAGGVTMIVPNTRDALLFIDFTQELLEAPTGDLSEFNAALDRINQQLGNRIRTNWLNALDSMVTMQTVPSFQATGNAFVRRALQHRIAALAIGIRLFEDSHARLPSSLKELSDLPVDIKQLSLSKDRTFGYCLEGGDAKLWGGTWIDAFAIPEEPADVDSNEDNDVSGHRFWLWEIPANGNKH